MGLISSQTKGDREALKKDRVVNRVKSRTDIKKAKRVI